MSRDPSVGLVDLLVADLTPVKLVPPLWQSVAATLAAGAVVAGIVSLTLGMRSGAWQDLAQDAGFLGVLVGLVAIAVAGCIAGLASAIPGRQSAVAIAAAFALLGVAATIGSATFLSTWGSAVSLLPNAADLDCMVGAILFSLFPIGVGLRLTWRTWAARPAATAVLTMLGTTALGTLIVHLCCPVLDGRHLLLGHCSTPLLMAAVGGAALASWMWRWAR
jgi:hypothetical protein